MLVSRAVTLLLLWLARLVYALVLMFVAALAVSVLVTSTMRAVTRR